MAAIADPSVSALLVELLAQVDPPGVPRNPLEDPSPALLEALRQVQESCLPFDPVEDVAEARAALIARRGVGSLFDPAG